MFVSGRLKGFLEPFRVFVFLIPSFHIIIKSLLSFLQKSAFSLLNCETLFFLFLYLLLPVKFATYVPMQYESKHWNAPAKGNFLLFLMLLWNEGNSGRGKERAELAVPCNHFVAEFMTGISVIYLSADQMILSWTFTD